MLLLAALLIQLVEEPPASDILQYAAADCGDTVECHGEGVIKVMQH